MEIQMIAQQMEELAEKTQGTAWICTGMAVVQGVRLSEEAWKRKGMDRKKRKKTGRKKRKGIKSGMLVMAVMAVAVGGAEKIYAQEIQEGCEQILLEAWDAETGWKEVPRENWESCGVLAEIEENHWRITLPGTGIYRISEREFMEQEKETEQSDKMEELEEAKQPEEMEEVEEAKQPEEMEEVEEAKQPEEMEKVEEAEQLQQPNEPEQEPIFQEVEKKEWVEEKPRWEEDHMAPCIQAVGIGEEFHYKKGMEIQAEVTDEWLDPGKTTCYLVGTEGQKYQLEKDVYDGTQKFIWKQERWETEGKELKNGRYELQIYGEDLAGNKTEEKIPFVMNRSGSVCQLVSPKEKENVMLVEENISPVTERKILCIWEGDSRILEEGKDYTVQEEKQGDTYIYRYQIKKEQVQRNGKYTMQIVSQDQAGNEKRNPVTFQVKDSWKKEKKREIKIPEKQPSCHHQSIGNQWWIGLMTMSGWYGRIRKRKRPLHKEKKSICSSHK